MAAYTFSPGTERGCFGVAIVGNDGVRQTIPGFKSYAAAEAWTAESAQRDDAEIHSSFRMQWRL